MPWCLPGTLAGRLEGFSFARNTSFLDRRVGGLLMDIRGTCSDRGLFMDRLATWWEQILLTDAGQRSFNGARGQEFDGRSSEQVAGKVKAGGAPTYTAPAILRLLLTSHLLFVLKISFFHSLFFILSRTILPPSQQPWSLRIQGV